MPDSLLSLVAFGGLVMATFGLGRPMLRWLGARPADRLATAVWSVALGSIAAGWLWLGLALVGGLYVPVIGLMTVAACFWGFLEVFRDLLQTAQRNASPEEAADPNRWDEPDQTPWSPPSRRLAGAVVMAAGAISAAWLCGALAPPATGEVFYGRLEMAKQFLTGHRLTFVPAHDGAGCPSLVDAWYGWGLALEGAVGAPLVGWGLKMLLGAATVVLAQPVLGRRWAWAAGALAVLTLAGSDPLAASPDRVALAALATLAVAAWWRGVVNDEGRRWLIASGLATGGALAVGQNAPVLAAAAVLVWLWALARRSDQRRLLWEGAAVVVAVAVVVVSPWWILSAWRHGPATVALLGDLAHAHGPQSGASQPWGAALVAAAPGVLLARRLRGLGILLAVASSYAMLCCVWCREEPWLCPAVGWLSVVAVWVWIEMRRFPRTARMAAAGAFAAMLAATSSAGLVRVGDRLAVAVGWENRDDYLVRHEPTYPAAVVVNAMAPADAHLLSQVDDTFYFHCRVTREDDCRFGMPANGSPEKPNDLGRRLRNRGFTHLLLARIVAGQEPPRDSPLACLMDAPCGDYSPDGFFMLTEYNHTDADRTVRHYRLIELR